MNRKIVIISIIASILAGGATGYVVSSSTKKMGYNNSGISGSDNSSFQFVNNPSTQNILPDFTQAAETGVKSVVNIDVIKNIPARGGYGYGGDEMDMFEYFFGNPNRAPQGQSDKPGMRQQRGGGSGVIISADGYIVSNNHVVEGADEIKVTTSTGEYYTATVIGTDPATDIALLKIEAKELPFLEFGNSDELRLGEWVLAIGNPYGLTSTVTQGIVSAKGRSVGMSRRSTLEIESFIQTDAVVNRGNSGGALITLNGHLVGINTMIFSETGSYAGYSFAIPSSIVRKVVADIREYGVVQRGLIGISMAEITPEWVENFGKELGVTEKGGIYIGEVLEGGAASAAGIKKGDIITEINGQKMNTVAEVQETISRLRPNDKVQIGIKRDGKVKHFDVTLRNKAGNTNIVTKPTFDLTKELGAQFKDITEKQKTELKIKYGIQVVRMDPNGILFRSRVKVGFIITSINDIPVTNVARLNSIDISSIETIEGVYPNGQRASYFAIRK